MIEARCTEMSWKLERTSRCRRQRRHALSKRPQGAQLLGGLPPGDTVVAARMDRCFRSALDALTVIEDFKRRRISLWMLDLGGEVTGNGISQLVMTMLAAFTQFERTLISERICDAKRQQRRAQRHLGGARPFGWRLGEAGDGKACELIPHPAEQAAIGTIQQLRSAGHTLMAIRDQIRAQGHQISHETVRAVLARAA